MIKTIQRLFASHFPNNRRKSLRRRGRPESLAGRPAEGLEERILLSSITGKLSLDRDADQTISDEGQSAGIDGVKISLVSVGIDGAYGTIDDQLFDSSITNVAGAFSFAGMSGGTYALAIDNVYYSTMFGTGNVELTHHENGTFVSSNFTLSANGTATINLGLQASGELEHRLFVLDKVLDLSYPAAGGMLNWGGRNEIWFQGSYNAAGNRWFFLTPDGAFYSWDGTAAASGPFLAQLSSSTYKNPATLSAAKPHLTTSNNVAETAFLLRHFFHIQPAAEDFLNSGGTNERWLLGDKNSFGNSWYFIRPDGSFYEWNGVARAAAGNLITKLTSDHYQKLELIFAATNPAATTPEMKAVAASAELGLKQSNSFATNWGGQGEKWLSGNANRFGNQWYYLLPNGDLHEWDGKGRALSGRRLYQLDSQTFSNPSRLFNSANSILLNATKWNALAVDQSLGLKYTGKSFEGYGGSPDKWLQGVRHDLGNSWYLVEPSGRVLKWDGKPGAPNGVAVSNVGGQAAKSVFFLASASPIAASTSTIPEDFSSRFVSLPLRTLDGTSDQFVDITTKLTAGKASFQEIGVFVMDSADGRVNGILPGSREYAAAVMNSAARQVFYVYGDALQTVDTHRLPANKQLGLYAIGMPGVSMRTGKDHLQVVSTGTHTGQVAWEEQTSVWPGVGNPKFDDAALELQYSDPIDVKDDCVFDDELTNWTISETGGSATGHGTVTAQDCFATLTEGDSFTTTLSTSFVVPPNATSLSFTYDNLNFDTSNPSFINDAFEVALVDQDGDSLVPTYAPNRDAFFNITEGLSFVRGTGIQIENNTVTVDLNGITAGANARLIFRLTNNDSDHGSDTTTTVRLVDLQLVPGVLFTAPPSEAAGSGSTTRSSSASPSGTNTSISSSSLVVSSDNPSPLPNPWGDSVVNADGQFIFDTTEEFSRGTLQNLNTNTVPDHLAVNAAADLETLPFIWISNSAEGTVSRFDTRTGKEVGRYRTGPGGDDPSRIAVTQEGDAWVANRGGRQTAVKILIDGFIDRNGNDELDTSHDANGDGIISPNEMLPWDANGDGQPDDERIAFVVNVGGGPRGVAIDANNKVWLAGSGATGFKVFDNETGVFETTVPTPFGSYGAVIDGRGHLWSAVGPGNAEVMRIDTNTRTYLETIRVASAYGITVDQNGIIWTSPWSGGQLSRYDADLRELTTYNVPATSGGGITADRQGNIWFGTHNSDRVWKFTFAADRKTLLSSESVRVGPAPKSASIDADGYLWTVCLGNSTAYKIDTTTNTIVPGWPVPTGAGPYNYSDMTGDRLQTVTLRSGTWTEIIDSGRLSSAWAGVEIVASLPSQSKVRLRVRSSNDRDALSLRTWQVVQPNQPLPSIAGRFLEVETRLTSDAPDVHPTIDTVTVESIQPPAVEIHQPLSERREPGTILLAGLAIPDRPVVGTSRVVNEVVFVTINGKPVDQLDALGNYFAAIDILPGVNRLEVTAHDRFGQSSTQTVFVEGMSPSETSIDFSRFSDTTGSFTGVYGRTSFETDTNQLYVDLATRNDGTFSTDVPLLVGVRNIRDPLVEVVNADGFLPDGTPYFDFTQFVTGGKLTPGQISGSPTISFYNPSRGQFKYDLVFLGKLNDPPEITTVPKIEAIAGKTYTYDVNAIDRDGDNLTYTLIQSPQGMQINSANGLISWVTTTSDVGQHDIVIHVSDGRGGSAEQHFVLNAIPAPPNRPPIITSKPVTTATSGVVTEEVKQVVDLGGWSVVQYEDNQQPDANWVLQSSNAVARQTVNADPSILVSDFQLVNDAIEGTWRTEDTGDDDFMGFVFGYQDSGHFYLFDWKRGDQTHRGFAERGMSVKVVAADTPLTGNDLWPTSGNGDRVRTLFHNTIPWAHNVDYQFGLEFRAGAFSITVKQNDVIIDSFTISDNTYANGNFGFYNYSQGLVNYSGFTRQALSEPTYHYDVAAIDPDDDALVYSIMTKPDGMAINGQTGLISWGPTAAQIGNHPVIVRVEDGRGGVAEQEFTVCVDPVDGNHAPIIVSEPLTTTRPSAAYSTTIQAVDPDQDSLVYELLTGPGGMLIDEVTGALTWTVPVTFSTPVNVAVEVHDGKGGKSQQEFVVSPPAGNAEIHGAKFHDRNADGQRGANFDVVGTNLVQNGSFENGLVGINSDYLHTPQGNTDEGTWWVTPQDPGGSWGPARSATNVGRLNANGDDSGSAGVKRVWFQSVNVEAGKHYNFSTWAWATHAALDGYQLRFAFDDVQIGGILTASTARSWEPFNATYFAQETGSVEISIVNVSGRTFPNDFMLDDISLTEVVPLEPGLANWTIYLDQNRNGQRDFGERATITNAEGNYSFADLPADTYFVREESRLGWRQTFPSQVPPGDGSHLVTITSGQIATGYNFGNVFTGDPQNTRPSFISTPVTNATPQQLYRYNATATDPNDDPITYRLVTGPEGMTVHPELGALVWMPSAEQVGSYSVVLEASDGKGGLAVQSFTLTVSSLNHAPVFTSTPPATATAGKTWSYLLAAQDADADSIAFSLETPPAGMTITATPIRNADGTLIETQYRAAWQVPANAAGTNPTITVAASDGKGGVDRQSWTLSILAAGASNSAPVFTSTPRPTARVGLVWSYGISTNDVDGDPVTLSLTQKPADMTLSAAGVLTWTPASTVPPSTTVKIVATDPRGAATTQEFTITVVASGVNNAPVIVSNPRLRAIEGSGYAYDAVAEDADGDELVWILENAPRGMSINSRTGQIRWTPDEEQRGSHAVSLKVVDAFQGESVQSFQIEVACTNTAPAILSVPPTIGISERTYLYAVRADDREGDTLTWRLTTAPVGMTIDPKTGVIRWIPTAAQVASHNVVVEASDGLSVGTQAYTIVVYSSDSLIDPNDPSKGTRGNRAPIINSSPVYSADVNKVYNYQVSAVDPDGDSVSLSLTGTVPQGLEMNAAGLISWTPAVAAIGEYLITVQARDTHGGVANQAYLLTVVQNRVPVISSVAGTSVTRGALYRYSVRATDPDGDALTYRLDQAPEGMSVDRFGRIIWQTDAANTTAKPVRLIVSDDRGGTATQVWEITPADDTEKPVVSIVITSGGQTYYGNATINQDSVYNVFVSATDNVGVTDIRLSVNGSLVSLNQNRSVTLAGKELGISQLRAIAVDAAGLEGSYDATVSVIDPTQPNRPVPTDPTLPPHPGFKPSDTGRPVVQITSPEMSATITNRTPIIGTVDDPENNLWYYRVYTSRVDRVSITNFDLSDPDWSILNTGTQEVINGQLGIFDASSLGNDPYVIAVAAYDVNGAGWIEAVLVNVEGNVLVGNFHLELTDLSIPLAGIPIQVTRVYDTINADLVGDFGYGWSLGVQDGRILEVAAVGAGGGLNPGDDKFVPGRTKVYLTNPDGKRVGFTYQEKLISYSFFGGMWTPYFVPDPGVYDTLTIDETQVARGGIVGALTQGINPDFYTLTTKDGLNYRYSDTAGLQTITDRNANKVTFTEDGIFHSDGESIRFVRDNKGRITSIVDPAGNTIKYAYDLKGDLAKVTNQAALSTRYVYRNSPAHYLDEAYDARDQRVLKAVYDAKNMFVGIFDALGNRVDNRVFDTANNTGIIRDALGNATTVVYDNRGNVLRETDPQGHVTIREYSDPRNPDLETRIIDRNDNVTTRAYDARGNVVQLAELGSQSNPLTNPVLTTMTYDVRNDVTSITNANGASTHFTYDGTGNLTAIVNALGNASYFTYDTQGRRSSVTDFNGNKTTFDYDDACPCGAPHKVIYADGTYQVFDYNQYGQATLEQWFEANGTLVEQKRTEYDATGRVTREIIGGGNDPKHPATEIRKFYTGDLLDWEIIVNPLSLNPDGSLKESPSTPIANRKSRITDYDYDANNRLVQQIDAMGGIVEFRYDVQGNRVLLQDPVGNITTWVYDTLNRVAEERDPFYNQTFTVDQAITALNVPSGASLANNQGAAHVRSFGYDAEGNQAEIIDRNNRRREFSYDYAGQMLEERWYTANNGALVETINFTYDTLGNMLTATNANSRYVYTYDTLNRVTSVDNLDSNPDTPHVVLYYGYDAQGNVIKTSDDAGVTVESTYNARNLLATRKWFDAIVPAGQTADVANARVDFSYTAAGRQKQIRRYSELAATTKVGSTDYTYDLAGRTDTLIHKNAIDALFSGYNYDYDFSGLLVGEQRDHQDNQYDQTISYGYDLTGQLLDAFFSGQDDEHYEYDANGNRMFSLVGTKASEYSIGPANQLMSDAVYRYEYDAEGNQIKRVNLATGATQTFEYTMRNRLVEIDDWSSDPGDPTHPAAGAIVTQAVKYTYDLFGRRINSSVDTDGMGPTAYKSTIYIHDRNNVWSDSASDGKGTYFLFGEAIDQALARYDAHSSEFWSLSDNLLTVRDAAERTGDLIRHADYSVFGNILGEIQLAEHHVLAFTGREFDINAGYYYYRSRFFDGSSARFLSRDPQVFEAGDSNLYRYVFNRPNAFSDPFGQTVFTESAFLQRIQTAQAAVVECLGKAAFTSIAEGGVYLLLTSVGATPLGPSNVYIGQAQNFVVRFTQHGATGVGGRGVGIISQIPISLSKEVLSDPKKLRTVEQIFINAFGGKAQLLNKINASRKLFC